MARPLEGLAAPAPAPTPDRDCTAGVFIFSKHPVLTFSVLTLGVFWVFRVLKCLPPRQPQQATGGLLPTNSLNQSMKNTKLALAAVALAAVAMLSITPAAFARGGDGSDDDSAATSTESRRDRRGRALINAADLACLSAAVSAREDALIAALDEFSADAKSALQARKTALVAAYAMTDRKEVRKAVKRTGAASRSTMKSARSELKAAKREAYADFKAAAKECGVNVESTDASAPGEEILL